jgi:hypothetical protein
MASDLSGLDLLVIQMDDIHMDEDLILMGWRVAAIGVDAKGNKHSLGLIASSRVRWRTPRPSLDPALPRLLIIDGAKALSKAIGRTFVHTAAIQLRLLCFGRPDFAKRVIFQIFSHLVSRNYALGLYFYLRLIIDCGARALLPRRASVLRQQNHLWSLSTIESMRSFTSYSFSRRARVAIFVAPTKWRSACSCSARSPLASLTVFSHCFASLL